MPAVGTRTRGKWFDGTQRFVIKTGKMVGWDTGRALRGGAARSVEPKIGAIANVAEIWHLD